MNQRDQPQAPRFASTSAPAMRQKPGHRQYDAVIREPRQAGGNTGAIVSDGKRKIRPPNQRLAPAEVVLDASITRLL